MRCVGGVSHFWEALCPLPHGNGTLTDRQHRTLLGVSACAHLCVCVCMCTCMCVCVAVCEGVMMCM